ncbi:MAG: PINc/VapC family ATPase [Candidatus Bipolaricaulia bacterium]
MTKSESKEKTGGPNRRFVLDTSVIVDGRINIEVEADKLSGVELIVPEAVVAELEYQTSQGQETGYTGLEELRKLQRLHHEKDLTLVYRGERPMVAAEPSEIDALVIEMAEAEGTTLITSNEIQALIAEVKGIPIWLYEVEEEEERRSFESMQLLSYFDEDTMSVHLRANARPKAKRGRPGSMEITYIGDESLTHDAVWRIAQEVIETAEVHHNGFIEMDAGGSTIVQLDNIRIAIARPPFSDALEITAVRPVARTEISDYSYAKLLQGRLKEQYHGVLVAGPPGAGKTTLVQAIATYLEEAGWVVKTMERPRDLEVSDEITQYTALDDDMAKTANILLLVRPDYTLFDEMRQTHDFQVFADLRMAGVGLVGVVHATRGIDAVQRLIGRVELGLIPQIVDTIVYIEEGDIEAFYDVDFAVKIPAGMESRDLARPVIEVRDVLTHALKYEIYTYGEQVVVMPIEVMEGKPIWQLAEQELRYRISQMVRGSVMVQVKSDDTAAIYVDRSQIPYILGRGGERIRRIEDQVSLHLDVRSFEEMGSNRVGTVEVESDDRHVIVNLHGLHGENVEILIDGERAFMGAVSKSGSIKLSHGTAVAEQIRKAHEAGSRIEVRRTD